MEKLFMKRMIVMGMLGLFGLVSSASAAQTDSIAVKVTIAPSISVSITEDSLALGSLAAGAVKVSASPVTVTNDGSGVNETYSLSLANPSGWTASQTAAGVETYVLSAAFSNAVSGTSWDVANHALSTTPVACSASKFAGDQTGVGVPYSGARKLWFQFKAPTSTTIGTEQSITVIVTAQAG